MSNFQGIRNGEQFVRWLKENVELLPEEPSYEDVAMWFVATNNARMLRNLSIKDLARMLLEGCEPMSMTSVDDFFEQMWEDVKYMRSKGERIDYLVNGIIENQKTMLKAHFGDDIKFD